MVIAEFQNTVATARRKGTRRKLTRRYLPPIGANRAGQQYRHCRRRFPEAVVLLQLGRAFELYDGAMRPLPGRST